MAGATIEVRKLDSNGTVVGTWAKDVFDTFGYDINTPATPTPLPEEDQSENILMKVEGNSGAVPFVFVIKDEDTNQITGSGITGDSKTVFEQVLVMKNQFRPVSIDDAYEIAIVVSGNDVITWSGTIVKMSARFTSMEPVSARVTIQFLEGNVITVYNIDGAKQPTNVTAATGGASGEIDMTWTLPTDTGTGNPTLSGYRIQYRKGSDDWTSVDYTPSASLKTITGLTAATSYQVRVASSTADAVGQFSAVRTAVSGA